MKFSAIRILLGLALVGATVGGARAQEPGGWSGNAMVAYCRGAIQVAERQEVPNDIASVHKRGACAGFFVTLMYFARSMNAELQFCPAAGATPIQAMKIVVKALDDRPDMLNVDLRDFSVFILQRTWPCT